MATLAFFDLDRTILRADSGLSWMRYQRRHGLTTRGMLGKAIYWSLLYRANLLDMDAVATRLTAGIEGDDEPRMRRIAQAWFQDDVIGMISNAARRAIDGHRRAGDHLVLATGSSQYVAEPIAALLGFADIVCTRLESRDGRFTGRLASKGYGTFKVEAARTLANALGARLEDATFYSDSFADWPLLSAVGRPVAVNPDRKLTAHAQQAGWPIAQWDAG